MTIVDDLNVTANKPADPAPTQEESLTSILALLANLASSMGSIASRLGVMEHRIDSLDRDVIRSLSPDARAKVDDGAEAEEKDVEEEGADVELRTEPDLHQRPILPPPLALRCDGRVLLSTVDLEGFDLTKWETFTGIVLTEAETSDVLDRTDDAFLDTAAHIVGMLRHKGKRIASQ